MDIQQAINITVSERMEGRPAENWDGSEPDFYRIALELEHLTTLGVTGWWGDWWGCMYAETAIRCFGPLVSLSAAACATGGEGSSETTTVSVLNCVDSYLDWEAAVPSSEDEVALALIERARTALEALNVHFLANAKPEARH